MFMCLLVLAGVSLGGPAAHPGQSAPDTYLFDHGSPLPHAVMTAPARPAIAAARPAATKASLSKRSGDALPPEEHTCVVPGVSGGPAPDAHASTFTGPAPRGYLARAPPARA